MLAGQCTPAHGPGARPPPPALSRGHGGCCGPRGRGEPGSPPGGTFVRRNLRAAERVPRGEEERRAAPSGAGPGGAVAGAGPAGLGQAASHVRGTAGAGGGQRRGPEGDADQLHGAAEGHRTVPGGAGRHGDAQRPWRGCTGARGGAAREGPRLWGGREQEKAPSVGLFCGIYLFLFYNQYGFSSPCCRLVASGAG